VGVRERRAITRPDQIEPGDTVSTYDDRTGNQSGHDDDGLFYPGTAAGSAASTYNSSGRDPSSSRFGGDDDFDTDTDFESGFTDTGSAPTTALTPPGPGTGAPAGLSFDDEIRPPVRWHGGADFGLLVLRLVIGGTFFGYGLQHLFGQFHGIGYNGFVKFLEGAGYQHASVMAYVAGGTELAGGALLVLGLFTPLAAAALLGLVANVIVLKWPLGFFAPGYELEMIVAAASFALLFAGPGRVALDRPTPWFRRPVLNGWLFLVVSAAATVAVLLLLRKH
jgi:putative oxidoreductase